MRFIVGLFLISTSFGLFSTVVPAGAVEMVRSPQASDGARRITPADLRALLKKNAAILVDVRSEESFKAGHIKGAKSIPFGEVGNRAGELPRDKLIATYCS